MTISKQGRESTVLSKNEPETKISMILLASLFFVALSFQAVSAQAGMPPNQEYAGAQSFEATQAVNLRASPQKGSAKLSVIKKGQRVQVFAIVGGYYKVLLANGGFGYTWHKFLRYIPSATSSVKEKTVANQKQVATKASKLSASLCNSDEILYHGCKTKKGKFISLCSQKEFENNFDQTPAYLVYRYGKPGKTELAFPANGIDGPDYFNVAMERYAGANTRFIVKGSPTHNLNTVYVYEEAYIGADHVHGIAVYKRDDFAKNKFLTFVECDDHNSKRTKPTHPKDIEFKYPE